MSRLFPKSFALSIGPQACGTDLLRDYFQSRRDVALPDVPEIFYFDRHIHRGPEFYQEHFQDHDSVVLFMELTTTAFDHPQAPRRVDALLGQDVKLLCPLRDPVERAIAVYNQYLSYGIVRGSFREACEQAPQILHAGRYAYHLQNWLSYFDNIYFMSFEALHAQTHNSLKDLCDYLDLDFEKPKRRFEFPKIFMNLCAGAHRSKFLLDEKDYDWLSQQMGDEVQHLENLLGRSVF